MVLWLSGKGLLAGINMYDPQAWELFHLKIAPFYQDNPIFIFPLPTAFLFAPFSFLPVRWSGALWLLINEVLTTMFFWWVIGKTQYKRKLGMVFLFALIVATFQPVIITLLSGQYNLFTLIILAAAYVLLHEEKDWPAGLITSLLLLRPNPFVFFIPGVLIWAMAHKRWKYIAGFTVASIGLFVISEMIQPGWIVTWLDFTIGSHGKLYSYGQIAPTLGGMLADIGRTLAPEVRTGINLMVTLLLCTAGIGVSLRKDVSLGYIFSALITISLCITPYAWNYDHVLLLFTLAYVILSQEKRTPRIRRVIWLLVILIYTLFPYFLRFVAVKRGTDTLSGLVPYAVLLLLLIIAIFHRSVPRVKETQRTPSLNSEAN